MTTKEKVLDESIARATKRLIEINAILGANPISEICNIRMEAQKLLNENKSVEQRTSAEFIAKIGELAKREKEQFRLAKLQDDSIKLIEEKVDLVLELGDLKNELWSINRNRV